jgi:uncharacterized protein HemX
MKILVDAWNHFLANSSYYLEAIVGLAIILFEIWCEDVTKTKYKILRTIMYLILFILAILIAKGIQILNFCQRNELRNNQKLTIRTLKTVNDTLSDSIKIKDEENEKFISEVKKEFNSFNNNIRRLNEEIEATDKTNNDIDVKVTVNNN